MSSGSRLSPPKSVQPGRSLSSAGVLKYLEAVCAADADRATQCGRPRRRRTRELNPLRCPFRLAILEAHNEGLTPEPVDTLTPLACGLMTK